MVLLTLTLLISLLLHQKIMGRHIINLKSFFVVVVVVLLYVCLFVFFFFFKKNLTISLLTLLLTRQL